MGCGVRLGASVMQKCSITGKLSLAISPLKGEKVRVKHDATCAVCVFHPCCWLAAFLEPSFPAVQDTRGQDACCWTGLKAHLGCAVPDPSCSMAEICSLPWSCAFGCTLELCINPHFCIGLCMSNAADEQVWTCR